MERVEVFGKLHSQLVAMYDCVGGLRPLPLAGTGVAVLAGGGVRGE